MYLGYGHQSEAIARVFASNLSRIRELYAPVETVLLTVEVPVFVAWGDRDPLFGVDIGRRTAALFPQSFSACTEGAGHFASVLAGTVSTTTAPAFRLSRSLGLRRPTHRVRPGATSSAGWVSVIKLPAGLRAQHDETTARSVNCAIRSNT
ncbi:hypothetical protein [Streptomyces sp. NPDC048623]|uniref:alpha/beta fold hydrolase n=1 Tax=Streptomyces sp. NPDC048623 TaxID=3155761 RepID=UPI00343FE83C